MFSWFELDHAICTFAEFYFYPEAFTLAITILEGNKRPYVLGYKLLSYLQTLKKKTELGNCNCTMIGKIPLNGSLEGLVNTFNIKRINNK